MEKYITVIGEVCLDINMHNPQSHVVYGQNIWAEDITISYGGSASIASAALARLGKMVRVYGTVGNDVEGDFIIRLLEEVGVDCSQLTVLKEAKTTKSMLQSKGADKTFLGCSPMLPISTPSIESLDETELVYVAGFVLYPELGNENSFRYFREAKRRGIPVILDGQCFGIPEIDEQICTLTKLLDMMPLSETFLAAQKELNHFHMTEQETKDYLLNLGAESVIFKNGKKGSVFYSRSESVAARSYLVDAFDTVGAGDAYGAGYAYALLKGWEKEKCIQFASVFSALSLGKYERTKKFPCEQQVLDIINSYYGGN